MRDALHYIPNLIPRPNSNTWIVEGEFKISNVKVGTYIVEAKAPTCLVYNII